MQVRTLSLLAATVAVSATAVAFAQNRDVQGPEGGGVPTTPVIMEYDPIKGAPAPSGVGEDIWTPAGSAAHIGSANGGVWKTTNGGAAEAAEVEAPAGTAAGLLLPAVQVSRDTPNPPPPPPPPPNAPAQMGVEAPQDEAAGLLLPAVQKAQDPPQEAQEERPRRRGGFSLSIGGVTVGTGGVNVAVGDVTGDGHGEGASRERSSGQRQSAPPRQR